MFLLLASTYSSAYNKREISHANDKNLSVSISSIKNQLYLLYVHPTLSVTDSLQFINLPCSVSQSSDESETKSDRIETALVSVPDNKQNKLKLNYVSNSAKQSNRNG